VSEEADGVGVSAEQADGGWVPGAGVSDARAPGSFVVCGARALLAREWDPPAASLFLLARPVSSPL
jgi:hypothetical protein